MKTKRLFKKTLGVLFLISPLIIVTIALAVKYGSSEAVLVVAGSIVIAAIFGALIALGVHLLHND